LIIRANFAASQIFTGSTTAPATSSKRAFPHSTYIYRQTLEILWFPPFLALSEGCLQAGEGKAVNDAFSGADDETRGPEKGDPGHVETDEEATGPNDVVFVNAMGCDGLLELRDETHGCY